MLKHVFNSVTDCVAAVTSSLLTSHLPQVDDVRQRNSKILNLLNRGFVAHTNKPATSGHDSPASMLLPHVPHMQICLGQ